MTGGYVVGEPIPGGPHAAFFVGWLAGAGPDRDPFTTATMYAVCTLLDQGAVCVGVPSLVSVAHTYLRPFDSMSDRAVRGEILKRVRGLESGPGPSLGRCPCGAGFVVPAVPVPVQLGEARRACDRPPVAAIDRVSSPLVEVPEEGSATVINSDWPMCVAGAWVTTPGGRVSVLCGRPTGHTGKHRTRNPSFSGPGTEAEWWRDGRVRCQWGEPVCGVFASFRRLSPGGRNRPRTSLSVCAEHRNPGPDGAVVAELVAVGGA